MLINGLKYIIPCQSQFSRKSTDEVIKSEYERISAIVKRCLNNNQMSATDAKAKAAFAELEKMMPNFYSKPLSRKLQQRAIREHRRMKRLRRLLRSRPDIIICRIDKNPAFYIGRAAIIAAKAQEYMDTTEAYQEITDGRSPLADHLRAVQRLLNYLVSQKAIDAAQRDQLLPNLNRLELAHFHTLPKVHKVRMIFSLRQLLCCFCFHSQAWR